MSGKYDDILHLPHHTSSKRTRMSALDRAAQFSPFAALTGYDAVIEEAGRLTDAPIELEEGAKAELDEKLNRILESIHTNPKVTITYFQRDQRKLGGAYLTAIGRVKKVDPYEMTLTMTDGSVIDLNLIYQIQI